MNAAIEYADYIFCNEDEAAKFGEINKVESTSLKDIAVALCKWKKVNTKRTRNVIVT